MSNNIQITVLKFGSSVLRDERDLPRVVQEIQRVRRSGSRVIAVVSAFGDTTNRLLARAERISSKPDESALATLLATGEAAASALLSLALNEAGVPARVLDPVQASLRTNGSQLDSSLIDVDVRRLVAESGDAVVVLPGFVGRNDHGATTLLGRGGSDLTALFLAQRLHGHCVLLKDVDGLYTSDPNAPLPPAFRFTQVSYKTAALIGGSVVQLKAVHFAEAGRQRFSITSIGSLTSTEVGPFTDLIEVDPAAHACCSSEEEECVA